MIQGETGGRYFQLYHSGPACGAANGHQWESAQEAQVQSWLMVCCMASKIMNLDWEITHYCEMGFAVNMVAAKLLTDGISSLYPNTQPNLDPEDWFVVHPLMPEDEEYTV